MTAVVAQPAAMGHGPHSSGGAQGPRIQDMYLDPQVYSKADVGCDLSLMNPDCGKRVLSIIYTNLIHGVFTKVVKIPLDSSRSPQTCQSIIDHVMGFQAKGLDESSRKDLSTRSKNILRICFPNQMGTLFTYLSGKIGRERAMNELMNKPDSFAGKVAYAADQQLPSY